VDRVTSQNAVVANYQQRVLEENTGLASKFSAYSPVLPNEFIIEKKGILGRAKLGIKSFGDKTVHNVESVYLKYSDISKRKFV